MKRAFKPAQDCQLTSHINGSCLSLFTLTFSQRKTVTSTSTVRSGRIPKNSSNSSQASSCTVTRSLRCGNYYKTPSTRFGKKWLMKGSTGPNPSDPQSRGNWVSSTMLISASTNPTTGHGSFVLTRAWE